MHNKGKRIKVVVRKIGQKKKQIQDRETLGEKQQASDARKMSSNNT